MSASPPEPAPEGDPSTDGSASPPTGLEDVVRLARDLLGASSVEVRLVEEGGGERTAARLGGEAGPGSVGEPGAALEIPLRPTLGLHGRILAHPPSGRGWQREDRERAASLARLAEAWLALAAMETEAGREREARRRLAARNAATRVLAEAEGVDEAIRRILQDFSGSLGWSMAAFWRKDPENLRLRCVELWVDPGTDLDDFAGLTRTVTFRRGEGLPGRVWESRRPAWVGDVEADENFPRAPAAAQAGLRGGFAFPVLVGGEFYGAVEIFTRDLTEPDAELLEVAGALGAQMGDFIQRTATEHALRESEERFRAFAESLSDGTFTIDGSSRIVQVNEAAARMFGYSVDELIGQSITLLMSDDMAEAHRAGVERYLSTGTRNIPWSGVQLPGRGRDGEEIPLEISFGEYELRGRHFFTGIARNVSDRIEQRRKLEETADRLAAVVEELEARTSEAEAARKEAEEANRTKADFLAVMSHELRTPLNAILGYVELMLDDIPVAVPPEAKEQLVRVDASSQHLLHLIEEILSFSRIEAGQEVVRIEEFQLGELLRESADIMRPLAERHGLSLTVDAPEQCPVRSDPAKIRQILFNLLSNAVKFTDEGKIHARAGCEQDELWISVRDTGIGVHEHDRERIFEAFRQVEHPDTRSEGGTGLGLSVSQQLAELLGGRIELESEVGRGSVFTVRLPVAPQE